METAQDLALAVALMLPFVLFYFLGVAVKVGCEKSRTKDSVRAEVRLQTVGEAMPGLFEALVTLATIFGGVFQSQQGNTRFQMMGIISSAAFLAFRGGYTYQESLLAIRQAPRSPRAVSDA